jgi:hypothetical protein
MKKTTRIIELLLGGKGNKQRVFPSEEHTQYLLATLISSEMSFEYKKLATEDLIYSHEAVMNAEQVAQVTEALFLCLTKEGCDEDDHFAHYCSLIRRGLNKSVPTRHGALIGSMQAVAWLYDNQLWEKLDLGVSYMGFINGYFLDSDEPQVRFDNKLSGTFSNISMSLVTACKKGLPEFFHSMTRYPIVWNPVPPQKSRIGESPLFRQIIDEISYRAFLLLETNERLAQLNSIHNPKPTIAG